MNKLSSLSGRGSLIERATEIYDVESALRGRAAPAVEVPADAPIVTPPAPVADIGASEATSTTEQPAFRARDWTGPVHPIDRIALQEAGYLLPDGPVTAMSEEFRLIKRSLLTQIATDPRGQSVLLCSANSGEGKTFCAINLALSLAAEKDREVLLVDADFGKPGIPEALGLTSGPGLMDALADPAIAIEDCVLRTDIPSLSILPAGARSNNDTEYLASSRTEAMLRGLTEGRPDRIILFDSPPLLAASPAVVLASHVAMALLVVRADRTPESTLRDAVSMLKDATQVQLLLNAVRFSSSGRRFGSYYAKEDAGA